MDYFVEKGAPKEKLIMGMPMYGQSFTLSSSDTSLNAPTSGAGKGGIFTQQGGLLAYMEICKLIQDEGWTVNPDEGICLQGPYAFKGTQWVSYDDPEAIRKKVSV